MKKTIFLFISLAFIGNTGFSQSKLTEAQEYFSVPGGAQNVDKKVLKGPDPQALPYVALKFRTASVQNYVTVEGRTMLEKDQTAKAPSYALLDGIDSALCQEITNEFTKIFIQKLGEAGVTFVDFEKVMNGKNYKKMMEEPSSRNYNHRDYGSAHVYTNNNIPFVESTTSMKGFKMAQENAAGQSSLCVTVDFVRFEANATKGKTNAGGEYNINFTSQAFPEIMISSANFSEEKQMTGAQAGGFLMGNTKLMQAIFSQSKPIAVPYQGTVEVYDEKAPKFAEKTAFKQIKEKVFGGNIVLGTFVIEADRETYKKAALDGLTKYAEYITEVVKSYNVK